MEVRSAIETVRIEKMDRIFRIKVLALVADLPAKADCLNMIAFNGYYGCSICQEKGCYLLEHRKMTYPITRVNAKIRDVVSHAENVKKASKTKPCLGVKGCSALAGLIDIPTAAPFDAMHLIHLGITKTLTTFALKKNMLHSDVTMQNAIIPKYFNRFPRNFANTATWKASDWKAFLLYSSIPVAYASVNFSCTKSRALLTLYVCLSTMVLLLSSEEVSEQDILNASSLIEIFQKTLQDEFGPASMTFSVHALKHLPEQVRGFGPLWKHSAFSFESVFGQLSRFVTGTANEAKLMVRRFLRYHSHLIRPSSISPKLDESIIKDGV